MLLPHSFACSSKTVDNASPSSDGWITNPSRAGVMTLEEFVWILKEMMAGSRDRSVYRQEMSKVTFGFIPAKVSVGDMVNSLSSLLMEILLSVAPKEHVHTISGC